jgi:hypothetical protein
MPAGLKAHASGRKVPAVGSNQCFRLTREFKPTILSRRFSAAASGWPVCGQTVKPPGLSTPPGAAATSCWHMRSQPCGRQGEPALPWCPQAPLGGLSGFGGPVFRSVAFVLQVRVWHVIPGVTVAELSSRFRIRIDLPSERAVRKFPRSGSTRSRPQSARATGSDCQSPSSSSLVLYCPDMWHR